MTCDEALRNMLCAYNKPKYDLLRPWGKGGN